jgi:hypothetical protein
MLDAAFKETDKAFEAMRRGGPAQYTLDDDQRELIVMSLMVMMQFRPNTAKKCREVAVVLDGVGVYDALTTIPKAFRGNHE